MNKLRKLKVLFISHQDPGIGGAPKSLIELMKNLKKMYHVDPIAIVENKDAVYSFCKENNIECYVLHHKDVTLGSQNSCISKIEFPLKKIRQRIIDRIALRKLEKKVNLKNIDLIHSNVSVVSIGSLISVKYNIPQIVHLRESLNYYSDKYIAINNYINYLNTHTTKFIAISNFIKRQWIDAGLDRNKIEKVYNGLILPDPKSNKDILKQNVIRAVIVGSIEKSKGQKIVIDALKKLSEQDKSHFHLDIIGKGFGDEEDNLKKSISDLPIVSFLGYKKDIQDRLNSYDVGIMASEAEAFGRVTVEYMAKGMLVIGANCGATPELIQEGKSGLLFEKNNSKSLARILHNIISDPQKFRKIGFLAQQRAYSQFTSIQNSKNIYQLYKHILNIKN